MVLVAGASASVAMLVTEFRAVYRKKVVGRSTFTFDDVAGMRAVVERAETSPEPQVYLARSIARNASAEVCSEFEVTWSFKRRG
jgi:hypothetical protein